MKNAMILLAILLSASTAVANVDDDTIKVTRVMLGGNVSKVSVEGYANVSIVADTVSYLTTEERFLSSGSDKRFTYSLNSQNGLTISADPGAKNLVLHLVQQGSLDLRTEDWASVSLNPIGNLQSLIINTSDYSSVSIMPNNREDTLKVDNINLHAEDFSKIALWPRCIGNTLSMNAEDHSMIQVSSFRGANIFKQVSDFAQLNLDSYALNYGGRKITFRDLFKRIDEASRAFRALGVQPGDIVSIVTVASVPCVVCFYALNKIGAVVDYINVLA